MVGEAVHETNQDLAVPSCHGMATYKTPKS